MPVLGEESFPRQVGAGRRAGGGELSLTACSLGLAPPTGAATEGSKLGWAG